MANTATVALGGLTTLAASAPTLTLVEPQITTTKTVNPTTNVSNGNTLHYSVSFQNAGGSTAYNVVMTDTLPTQATYDAGSISCTLNGAGVAARVISTTPLRIDGGAAPANVWDIPVGQTLQCTYTATAGSLVASTSYNNTADANWTSLDSANVGDIYSATSGRVYDDGVTVATPGTPWAIDGTLDTQTATFTSAALTGTLSGHVFRDDNGNGTQDGTEPALVGVLVTITGPTNTTATTDASGNYTASVAPGSYSADVTDPAGFTLTTANDPQSSLAVTAGNPTSATPVGFQPRGTLSGHVFRDDNGNGTQDGTEPVLVGVLVTITGPTNTTATTDASGNYTASVAPGTYTADVTDPANMALTTANDPQSSLAVTAGNPTSATPVGYQPRGTLSGHVFRDDNGNGTQDGTEPALVGVLVTITGPTNTTATTDASGNYTASVAPGSYTADVTDPANMALTTANDPQSSLAVTAGNPTSATPVGYQPRGTLSGHVFRDDNGNGTQDGTEPALVGVLVTITGPTNTTATTDASGNYTASVAPGSYSADVTDPAGFTLTTANDPQSGLAVTAGNPTSATPVGFQPRGTLSGHVFRDDNGNGTQDGTEPVLVGVLVTITGPTNTTATTDASGNYMASVAPGSYTADVTDPANMALTTANDPQSSLAVTAGNPTSATPVGYQPRGTLSGHVFRDDNGNGTQDGTEPALVGVLVTITGPTNTTATTDASGNYTASVAPGSYSADVTDPAGFTLTTANDPQSGLAVTAGNPTSATPVGFQPRGTLSGHVFRDDNGNGTQDGTEPVLVGVTVTITGPTNTTATTDASGNYTASVAPGTYTADVTDPAGFTLTTANDPQSSLAVTAGNTTNATPVGFQPPATTGTLSGHVFRDDNGNGTQDGTEPVLVGVTVTITGPTNTTATTDASGNYTASVAPGSYSADVTDPAGFTLTTANDPQSGLAVTAGNPTSATPVGFQPRGTLSGHVFRDDNGNGTQDETEPVLVGVTVTITGPTNTTATTDASGNYTASVAPGTYTADVADPAGFTLTTANDPQSGLAVTAGNTTNATPVGFQPPATTGTLSGHVFRDDNGNGTQDGTEPALVGVTVTITGPTNTTATTDASGNYTASVAPGTYTADVADPAGFTLTTANDPQSGLAVTAGNTTNATPVGFQPPATTGTLSGHVFRDDNGNGTQDGTEPALVGVTVTITGPTNTTATTDASGNYTASVAPGTYTADVADPAGFTLTTANDPQSGLAVTAGNTTNATPVGFQPPATTGTLSGHVFRDDNGNGTQDGTEPVLVGVTVTITGPTNTTATTDASGNYTASVAPGTYTADVADPAGFTLTTANDPQSGLAVTAGNTTNATPVGFQPPATTGTLSGHVFRDDNGNGTQDAGELNLVGVTVTITGPTNTTVATDANGNYSVSVVPGTYSADVTDPASFTLTTANDPQSGLLVAVGAASSATPVGFQPPKPGATATSKPGATVTPAVSVADPAITKSGSPALVLPGENVTWTITVTNKGTAPESNVIVTDRVPSAFIVLSASGAPNAIRGNMVIFSMGTLNPGQVITLTVLTKVRPDVVPPADLSNNVELIDSLGT